MDASLAQWLPLAAPLLATGLAAGLIGGLLGVGGGIVIVPVLYHVFREQGIDASVRMHLAVGTSLGTAAYVASKHAIIGLTKAAALEYAKQGLRINAVCPGFIQTALIEVATNNPEISDAIVAAHPVGRIGKPEEVAAAVIWLCSDGASFITGQSMIIDGGYIAQ